MTKIALFIIYNHHFIKYIDRIEQLYESKFSNIFHIIPFYRGNKKNVITVYENSYQFQSYISQAYQRVKEMGFTHYFIVADDMIINPAINENNIFDFTGIGVDSSYITDLRDFNTPVHKYNIPLCLKMEKPRVELEGIIPSKEEVQHRLLELGLYSLPSTKTALSILVYNIKHFKIVHSCFRTINYLRNRNKPDSYPAIWGYSDILLIPCESMLDFTTYCGAFAALDIFVEHAIPLALVLSSRKITLGKDLKLNSITQLYSLGKEGERQFYDKYCYKLDKLIEGYPTDLFFVHPIKLSKWS